MIEIVEALGHWALGMLGLLFASAIIIAVIWLFKELGEFLFACIFGCAIITALIFGPAMAGERMIGWWQGG